MTFRLLTAAAFSLFSATAAFAGPAADLTRTHLYAGSLDEGIAALTGMTKANPEDGEAWFGLGMIEFVDAVENLGAGLYRLGLADTPRFSMPMLRLPVPANPNPEELTPESFKAVMMGFEADLEQADAALARVGDKDAHIDLDLTRIALNFTGDAGKATPLWHILVDIYGPEMADELKSTTFAVGFDTADAAWLRGYSNVFLALSGILNAHDTSDLVTYGLAPFFPQSSSTYRILNDPSVRAPDTYETDIGDLIALVLTFRFPLEDEARMKGVRDRLKVVTETSRQSWALARAETDNHLEWLPSPKQTAVIQGMAVTDTHIGTWMQVLDRVDAMLDGKSTLPFWRFNKGFNLGAFFDNPPKVFNLGLLLAGPGAVPYLGDQPAATDGWEAIDEAFDGQFLGYAVWFN